MASAAENNSGLLDSGSSSQQMYLLPEMAISQKMTSLGYKKYQIDAAQKNFARFCAGGTGKILQSQILSADPILTIDQIPLNEIELGKKVIAASKVGIIKLAGGLGTSMKLNESKLKIVVRGGDPFIEIINKQVLSLRQTYNCNLPALLMTSRHTEDDVSKMLHFQNGGGIPTTFLQGEAPRLVASTRMPIVCKDKNAEMYPPGHGSIFSELYHSGLLRELYNSGVDTLFLSNGDNLGATLDPALVGHFVAAGAPFMSETTPSTLADTKGGYICRDLKGRLMTCETAQLEDPSAVVGNELYSHFHINNLYVNTKALLDYMDSHDGYVEMSLIINEKEVDGVPVIQLENAMGSAVNCFEGAIAIEVGRTRFLPVKKTCDLMFLRSKDGVSYDPNTGILVPLINAVPITLDDVYYKGIKDFDSRITAPVSLRDCESIDIKGDIHLGEGVVFKGKVKLKNNSGEPVYIENQVLEGDITY